MMARVYAPMRRQLARRKPLEARDNLNMLREQVPKWGHEVVVWSDPGRGRQGIQVNFQSQTPRATLSCSAGKLGGNERSKTATWGSGRQILTLAIYKNILLR